jgi:hypothetical protein
MARTVFDRQSQPADFAAANSVCIPAPSPSAKASEKFARWVI